MEQFLSLLKKHENWRKNCINLIASENVMSPFCEKVYLSDLQYRYAEGLPFKRYYQGLKYVDEMETIAARAFEKHFGANLADLRPISGTLANLAAFSALAQKDDKILTLGMQGGSHISHERVGAAGLLGFDIHHLDFDRENLTIDLEKAKEKILQLKPKFIVIGGSVILFPQPVSGLKEICQKVGAKIIYDGAHVFGLIASGLFQDPLGEGADLITASTHKTFPGPQGGIILGNVDNDLQKEIKKKVFPGSVSNHHLHRLPAAFVALKEMEKFGTDYSRQTISNAKALGEALCGLGFRVLGANKGFTESHQLVVDVEEFGGGAKAAKMFEAVNIILNKNVLPGGKLDVINPTGIRIGVQEMTRFGMKEKEMAEIARLMKKAIIDEKEPEAVKREVIDFRKNFQELKYCFKI